MPPYVNGYMFGFHASYSHIGGLPLIRVRMTVIGVPDFVPVIAKLNTSIRNSILTFDTARTLGIENPKKGTDKTVLNPVTGRRIPCYVHLVSVQVGVYGMGIPFEFRLLPAFTDRLTENFFGMDWTCNFCLAVDGRRVHLLRP